ncbi:MAG: type III secretion system chaperone [Pseudomonadota bacterium]
MGFSFPPACDHPTESLALLKDWLDSFVQRTLGEEGLASCTRQVGALDDLAVLGVRYGDLDIFIEVDAAQHVHLYVRLLALAEPTAPSMLRFFSHLLTLNAFCLATAGATLALDPDAPFVLLCARQPMRGLDVDLFVRWLSDFVRQADALHESLQHALSLLEGAG